MTYSMDVRQAIGPEEAARRGTQALRSAFLIENLFAPGAIGLTYSHLDRMIVGGVVPVDAALTIDRVPETGTPGFLNRREAAILNVGDAPGTVTVAGTTHRLGHRDALYVGMGQGPMRFASEASVSPARFYLVSAPAHRACPTVAITLEMARKLAMGSAQDANARTINQYVHPEICESCQLLVGLTEFEPGSVWNTMPAHLHDRRMEAYLYFGMEAKTRVFHFMGEPHETRHLVVKDGEAILSPPWSIHSGAGTGRYSFVWAMAGDNVDFADMDKVPMDALR